MNTVYFEDAGFSYPNGVNYKDCGASNTNSRDGQDDSGENCEATPNSSFSRRRGVSGQASLATSCSTTSSASTIPVSAPGSPRPAMRQSAECLISYLMRCRFVSSPSFNKP